MNKAIETLQEKYTLLSSVCHSKDNQIGELQQEADVLRKQIKQLDTAINMLKESFKD